LTAIQSTDEQLAMIKSGDSGTLPVIRPHMEKCIITSKKERSFFQNFLSLFSTNKKS
jgi:hypothetical protein